MREIRKSGSMSGEGKRSDARRAKPPRPSSTLLRAPDAYFGFPTPADERYFASVDAAMTRIRDKALVDIPAAPA